MLGLRVVSTYVGSAALLPILNAKLHPIALEVPKAAPTLPTFVVQVALLMVIGEFFTPTGGTDSNTAARSSSNTCIKRTIGWGIR